MPVVAIGMVGVQNEVVESGAVVLADGHTHVQVAVGSVGGQLLLEVDPSVSQATPGAGGAHLRLPKLPHGTSNLSWSTFNIGPETFRISVESRGLSQGPVHWSVIAYTIYKP